MPQTCTTATLLRDHDWAATPLGPIAAWPQSLRTAVDLMLASGHAMCLAWGPERTFLYNDAYIPLLGTRHPAAFGAPFAEVWPDVWTEIEPLVDATFAGETSTFHDMPLVMTRHGFAEETWWSFSYSPIRDEGGRVAGLLNVTTETTDRILAERERDRVTAELKASETKWRSVFETLKEGFVLGKLIRDGDGRVVDWRYEEVNDAWHDLVGIERGSAQGRTIREIFPAIEDAWIDEFAEVTERDHPIRFTRQVGALGRWYDGVAQHAGGDQFTVIFTEVTERVQRERRQDALITLNDRLRDAASVAEMTAAASEMLGAALAADWVAYGNVDIAAEMAAVESKWAKDGTGSIGRELRLGSLGEAADEVKAGNAVAVADCRADPRTRQHASALQAIGARSFVAAPVIDRGMLTALVVVATAEPRRWSPDEAQFVRDTAYRVRIESERLRAIEQQDVLNGELSHRVKNTLSVVQAIAMQTLAGKADQLAVDEFGSRLKALSSAHDVLLTRSWSAAALRDVACGALSTFGPDRIRLDGPDLMIGSRAAMSLALLLHELATNAVKYGALSVPEGLVDLAWRIDGDGAQAELRMTWAERGGPPAIASAHRGFGSRIIRMGLIGSGGVNLDYATQGLTVEMAAPLHQVQQA